MKPAINMGDMVVIGPLSGPLNGEVKPGAIVTYERGKGLVTHRVLSVDGDTLVTKGDAMEDPDPRPVTMSQVSGVYLFRIPYIGYLSNFMRTRLGWFLVIIIPGTALVSFLIKDIVKEALRSEPGKASGSAIRRDAAVKVDGNTQCIDDWYDPWRYRRSINIGNGTGAHIDAKVKVAINTRELIAVGKMQPDGRDIRFTKADKITKIPYWIESGINTTSTVIWVRIRFIPSGGSNIYLYYGNPAAAPDSDKIATFMFNEDFKKQAVGKTPMVGV